MKNPNETNYVHVNSHGVGQSDMIQKIKFKTFVRMQLL